jgi:hypothetical protein
MTDTSPIRRRHSTGSLWERAFGYPGAQAKVGSAGPRSTDLLDQQGGRP